MQKSEETGRFKYHFNYQLNGEQSPTVSFILTADAN